MVRNIKKHLYTAAIAFSNEYQMGKRKQNYLSKDEAKTLNERYKKFNELVEKEYLGGNQLFSEEILTGI